MEEEVGIDGELSAEIGSRLEEDWISEEEAITRSRWRPAALIRCSVCTL